MPVIILDWLLEIVQGFLVAAAIHWASATVQSCFAAFSAVADPE